MNSSQKAALVHLINTGVINANTGRIDFNKAIKSGITPSKGHGSGGGRSGAGNKNGARNGK